jgi:hypothetical protein
MPLPAPYFPNMDILSSAVGWEAPLPTVLGLPGTSPRRPETGLGRRRERACRSSEETFAGQQRLIWIIRPSNYENVRNSAFAPKSRKGGLPSDHGRNVLSCTPFGIAPGAQEPEVT